ncbi:WD40-repeat-containing domain protein [Chytridium lagenaria]|nr:WD40-repeat-containing domain protein [Chytridium lagenaria]
MSSTRLVSISSVAKIWELSSPSPSSPHKQNFQIHQSYRSILRYIVPISWMELGRLMEKYFATCGTDNAISVFDVKTGKVVEVVPGVKMPGANVSGGAQIRTLAFGPRRESPTSLFLRGLPDRFMFGIVMTVSSLTVCLAIKILLSALSISVDEQSLVSGGSNGEIMLFSLKSNTPTIMKLSFSKGCLQIAFSPFKKSIFAACGQDGVVAVWDVNQSSSPAFVVRDALWRRYMDCVLVLVHASIFATASFDRKLKVFDKNEKGLSMNDDFLIAAGTLNGKVLVYDIRAKTLIHTFSVGDQTAVASLAFEPPQWAREAAARDAGSKTSTSTLNLASRAKNPDPAPPVLTGSSSPMVAALKERMAAVKEKNLMDMFSPVKTVGKITLDDPRVKDLRNTTSNLVPKSESTNSLTLGTGTAPVKDLRTTSSLVKSFSPPSPTLGSATASPTTDTRSGSAVAGLKNLTSSLSAKLSASVPTSSASSSPTPATDMKTANLGTGLKAANPGSLFKLSSSSLKSSAPPSPTLKTASSLISITASSTGKAASAASILLRNITSIPDSPPKSGTSAPASTDARSATGGMVGRGVSEPETAWVDSTTNEKLRNSTTRHDGVGRLAAVMDGMVGLKTAWEAPDVGGDVGKGGADAGRGGMVGGGVQMKVIEGVLEECLSEFREEMRGQIQDMHLEVLRQFHIQKNEIETLLMHYSPTAALQEEVRQLREENARLRCGVLAGGGLERAARGLGLAGDVGVRFDGNGVQMKKAGVDV